MPQALPSLTRSTTWPTGRQLALLMLPLVTATLLGLHDISFWPHFDELWHLALSTGRGSAHMTMPRDVLIESAPSVTSVEHAPPIWRIYGSLNTVTHPPLYSILLRLWRDVFGDNLVTARVLSVIFFVLSIAVLFDAVRLIHPTSTAVWASLLMAVSSAQLQTAQQAKNYSLELLCVAAVINVLIRVQVFGLGRQRLVWLFAWSLAALFTHYFASFAFAAVGVYALLQLRGRVRVTTIATLAAAFAVYLVLWFPMLRAQRGAIDDATLLTPLAQVGERAWRDEFVRLLLTPQRLLFPPRPSDALAPRLSGVLLILPWILLRRRPKLLLWVLLLDICVGAIVFMDFYRQTKNLAQIRHVLAAGIGLVVLIPAMLEREKSWLRHGVPAVVVLACLGVLGLPLQPGMPDYQTVGRAIGDPRYRREPLVIIVDPFANWKADVNQLVASHYSRSFPRPLLRLTHALDSATLKQLHRWPGAVIVCANWQVGGSDIQNCGQLELLTGEPYIGSVLHVTWPTPPANNPSTMPAIAPASLP